MPNEMHWWWLSAVLKSVLRLGLGSGERLLLTMSNTCLYGLWWGEKQTVVGAQLPPKHHATFNNLVSTHQADGVNLPPWNTTLYLPVFFCPFHQRKISFFKSFQPP